MPEPREQRLLEAERASTTRGGYARDQVVSALQKTIRRGDEDGALFWASELDLSHSGEYVWRRLRIIASEDVGLADPQAVLLVRALWENWQFEAAP